MSFWIAIFWITCRTLVLSSDTLWLNRLMANVGGVT